MTGELSAVLASEMAPGQYVTVDTGTLFGCVISAVTSSPADHAFLHLGDGLIAEAVPSGVQVTSISKYRHRPMWACGDALSAPQQVLACKAARSFAGEEYGWADLALIALRRLGLHSPLLRRALRDRDALICSQMIALCGLAAGLPSWLCGRDDPALVTPADLLGRPGCARMGWG